MNIFDGKKCEVCGKPAAFVVFDIKEAGPIDGVKQYKRIEPGHYFCSDHERKSERYEL